MSTAFTLDPKTARQLVLHLQGLSEPPRKKLTSEGLDALLERMGFVQIDSINTVERAHHMILFARNTTYRQKHLARAVEKHRSAFENWTHDASIISSSFFPFWQARFRREKTRLAKMYNNWHGDGCLSEAAKVLEHVRENGPVQSRDFAADRKGKAGGWWDWHPSKTALEFLWRTGDLAVSGRQGFQKIYDLTERVLPDHVDCEDHHDEALIDWACRSALERLGYGSAADIAGFWASITTAEANDWLKRQSTDTAMPVRVEAVDGSPPRQVFARPDLEAVCESLPQPLDRLRILSPFDPLIRDRKRLMKLFGFDYRIEVFVPAEKRVYGYYVFPILERDRMIGRIDMKADRSTGTLNVTNLWLEPGIKLTKGRTAAIAAELDRLRRFAGLETVTGFS